MSHEIILFCVIRNDLQRLKQFLSYYRNLGVTSFIFMDNASTDGTYEYLQEQSDVTLYRETSKYSAINRNIWVHNLLETHGRNKWCIVADSDEFISYIGCETHNLSDLIEVAEAENYDAITGFLLDMYSESKMFDAKTFSMDNQQYFDYTGYTIENQWFGIIMYGGPRKRLFDINNGIAKYSLFYYREGISYTNAHHLRIDNTVRLSPIWFAIRHYKFQTEFDLTKMRDAVANRTYYNNSKDYVPIYEYMQKRCTPTMYNYDVSRLYKNSKSLRCIDILQEPFGK